MSSELGAIQTATDAPRARRRARGRNSTRDREKAELLALRRLTSELEAHLAELAAPRSVTKRQVRVGIGTWKRVAERQEMAKRASQHKRRALVAEVQRNADWVHRLWELLREPPAVQRPLVGGHGCKGSDAVLLERLKTEARAASWAAVREFAASGISIVGSGPGSNDGEQQEDRWSRTFDADSGTARLVCVRLLPFDVLATSAAVWSALTAMENTSASSCAGDDVHAEALAVRVLERSHYACALKYGQALSLDGQAARMRTVAVVQALAGGEIQGSKLFVWRSQSTVQMSDDDRSPNSVSSDDVLWIAVTSRPSSYQASTVAIIGQSQVEVASEELMRSHGLMELQETVKTAVERCVDETVLTAENLLIDGEVARQRTNSQPEPFFVTV